MSESQTEHHRNVRSFVRREGRMTPSQKRALDVLWPRFGIDYAPEPLDLRQAFGRDAPCVLEIGFGNGDTLAQLASMNPHINYLGVEVHRPGVGRLLMHLEQQELANVRVICHDAIEVLTHQFTSQSLSAVQLFFPDPWPKKRHHKRRILQPVFLALVADKLADGGRFHMATDWQDYAEQSLVVLSESPLFENTAVDGGYCPRPQYRPVTKFERRGQRLGHGTWDIIFRRVPRAG